MRETIDRKKTNSVNGKWLKNLTHNCMRLKASEEIIM